MSGNIPSELQQLKRWVVWKMGVGKNSKRPYCAKTGKPASVSDSKTWNTFFVAKEKVLNGGADGVGFVLTEDDPYTFIDLDDVIADGYIEPWAEEIVKRFNSYTEVSQSGKGVHILLKGKKPGDRSRSEKVEVYDKERYFALTGELFKDHLCHIEDRQAQLSEFYKETFTDGAVCEENEYQTIANEIILKKNAEPPEEKLNRLYDKKDFIDTWNKRRDFPSLSEYDLSLAKHAAENGWTDQEIADLIIAFRRNHGGEKDIEKALRPDYIARTITKIRSGISAEQRCDLTDLGNCSVSRPFGVKRVKIA